MRISDWSSDVCSSDLVVRRQLGAQRAIRNLSLDVRSGNALHETHQLRIDDKAEPARFQHRVEARPHQLLRARPQTEQFELARAALAIGLGHHPGSRALNTSRVYDLSSTALQKWR